MSESVASILLAKKGNFLHALKTLRDTTLWIVDSGASDHMTDSHQHFTTYTPCASNLKVKIADGSLAPIAGKRKYSNFRAYHSGICFTCAKISMQLIIC